MDLFVHFANSLHNPCLPKFAEAVCRRSFEGSKANVSGGQDDVMIVRAHDSYFNKPLKTLQL